MARATSTSRAFESPLTYIQGWGELKNLPEYTGRYGKTVCCIIDSFLFDRISTILQQAYSGTGSILSLLPFSGEITHKSVAETTEQVRGLQPDVVVGIGGGKALDTAKLAANRIGVPVISAPTVASTDAPTSSVAVIYSESHELVENVHFPSSPNIVLLDTEIISSAPVRLFVAGMGDALSTYFEARANIRSDFNNYVGKGYVRTRMAIAAAELCYQILMEEGREAKICMEHGICSPAVEDVIEANTLLSGLGFVNCGCAAAHAINDGIGALPDAHHLQHGEKVAFGVICQLVMENSPIEEIEKVICFCLDVGLPVCFSDLGVEKTEESVMKLSIRATQERCCMYDEPFAIFPERVYRAVIAADALGEHYKALRKAGE